MSNLTIFSSQNLPRPRFDLRLYAERLIIDSFEEIVKGKINLINAPTGAGKTYHTINHMMRKAMMGVDRLVFVAPSTSIASQTYRDINAQIDKSTVIEIVGIKVFYGDVDGWLKSKSPYTKILVTTTQHASVAKNGVMDKILSARPDYVYIDEADLGGNTDAYMKGLEANKKPYLYNATFAKFALACVEIGCYVIHLTATPLKQQREMFGDEFFYHVNKDKEWISHEEMTEGSKQLRNLKTFDSDYVPYITSIEYALDSHYAKMEEITLLDKLILKKDPNSPVKWKSTVLFNGGQEYKSGKSSPNSLTINEQLHAATKIINQKYSQFHNKEDLIFALAYKDKFYLSNLKGNKKIINDWDEINDKLENPDDPLKFLFFVAKVGRGVNIENCDMIVQSRERLQSVSEKEFVQIQSVLQIYGRAVRPYFGLKDKKFHFVSDVNEWLHNTYANDANGCEIKNLYLNRFKLINSCDIISSENNTFDRANEVFMEEYITSIENSQFNAMFVPDEAITGSLDKFLIEPSQDIQPHPPTCNCPDCPIHNGKVKQGLDKTLGI